MLPFECLIQVLNGLLQEGQFSSLNAVQNAVFIPKERPKSFRTVALNQRLAKNHDCRSERQPFERHMVRRYNGIVIIVQHICFFFTTYILE